MITVYRIEKESRSNDWPPKGTLFSEGRWNAKGMWIIYCSSTISLSKLETLANSRTLPTGRVIIEISIHGKAPIKQINRSFLPDNWLQVPYPKQLHQFIEGQLMKNKYVALVVPSRQSPRESNYLLNPLHPDFHKYVKVKQIILLEFDPRLKD